VCTLDDYSVEEAATLEAYVPMLGGWNYSQHFASCPLGCSAKGCLCRVSTCCPCRLLAPSPLFAEREHYCSV
jgi:hypothetical protein